MPTLLLGILVLLLILWAMNVFARADPRTVVRFAKVSGGTVALAGAATLAVTGRVGLAVPLGIAGLTLLGLWPGMSAFGRRARSGGAVLPLFVLDALRVAREIPTVAQLISARARSGSSDFDLIVRAQ